MTSRTSYSEAPQDSTKLVRILTCQSWPESPSTLKQVSRETAGHLSYRQRQTRMHPKRLLYKQQTTYGIHYTESALHLDLKRIKTSVIQPSTVIDIHDCILQTIRDPPNSIQSGYAFPTRQICQERPTFPLECRLESSSCLAFDQAQCCVTSSRLRWLDLAPLCA